MGWINGGNFIFKCNLIKERTLKRIETILERWDTDRNFPKPKCIYCGGEIIRSANSFGLWNYQCGKCGKLFNYYDVIDEIKKIIENKGRFNV